MSKKRGLIGVGITPRPSRPASIDNLPIYPQVWACQSLPGVPAKGTLPRYPGSLVDLTQMLQSHVQFAPRQSDTSALTRAQRAGALPADTPRQQVDFWRGALTDAEVIRNFDNEKLVAHMRPADPARDELGIAKRLRIRQAVFQQAHRAMAYFEGDKSLDPLDYQAERERCEAIRREAREKLYRKLTREVAAIDKRLAQRREDGDPEWMIRESRESRRLAELKFHQQRLAALLAAQNQPSPETEDSDV